MLKTTLFSITLIVWVAFPIITILYIINDIDIPSNNLNNYTYYNY